MTARAIHGSEASLLPKIHYFGTVSSTFDEAWRLYAEGRLGQWDSVIARSQTAGRGQLRRGWISPPGNLYWTVRLPCVEPFDSPGAAVALGALIANALCDLGCEALLKWPNDIVARTEKGIAKIAGILLEEKDGCVLAGIGINIAAAPEAAELKAEGAMPATTLAACAPGASLPPPSEIGRQILRHIRSACKDGGVFASLWRDLAAARLLWTGQEVIVREGEKELRGVFLGLGKDGCALIEQDGATHEIYGGTMRAAGQAGQTEICGMAREE